MIAHHQPDDRRVHDCQSCKHPDGCHGSGFKVFRTWPDGRTEWREGGTCARYQEVDPHTLQDRR